LFSNEAESSYFRQVFEKESCQMPLEKIVLDHDRAWALWQIREDETALAKQLRSEIVPPSITNPQKRLEFLSGRLLVKEIMQAMGLTYRGITKDEYGKPFPAESPYQLSLSHSYPYVAALIDKVESVGIDLEQPKTKLLKIAPRVMHLEELDDAGTDLIKHCIYWCAKEVMVKVHGKKNLTFAENLLISPFLRKSEGFITGRILVDNSVQVVPLYYRVYPNFVLVFNQRSES
jgi:4'-phosphopantetheinyl transferase EntD